MDQWGRPRHAQLRHNQRVRGRSTWSKEDQRLRRHEQAKFRARRGRGTWSDEDKRLRRRREARISSREGRGLWADQVSRRDRARRHGGRAQPRSPARRGWYPAAAVVGVLILLVAFRVPVVAVLVLVGAALVVMARRGKRQRR